MPASLASANPWLILFALAFFELAIIISGVKWNVLLRAVDVQVRSAQLCSTCSSVSSSITCSRPTSAATSSAAMGWHAPPTAPLMQRSRSWWTAGGLLAYMSIAAVMAIVVITVMGHADLRWLFNLALVALVVMVAAMAVLFSRRLRRQVGQIFDWGR